ncbi:MAG: DMT family transporter [Ketobacteraceae bacterium]|nr:DMT family transporter [Ketobacteraceae bacterium]
MADFLLLIVTLLASAGWMFSKEALEGLPPLLFIGTRFFLAGMVIALFCLPTLRRLNRQAYWQGIKVGLMFGGAMICWIHGLYHIQHVGEGAFITSMAVVLVPVFARLWFREQPEWSTWLALPVAVTGLGFLSLNNGFRLEPGQLFFLMAAVVFALHFNMITQAVKHLNALPLTAIQLLVVGVMTFSLSVATESWPDRIAPDIAGWVLASALIATSLRFFIQTHAQGLAPASHAALILTVEPIWTALVASFWLGETMSAYQLLGCSCIFAALIISRWRWVMLLTGRKQPALPARKQDD